MKSPLLGVKFGYWIEEADITVRIGYNQTQICVVMCVYEVCERVYEVCEVMCVYEVCELRF